MTETGRIAPDTLATALGAYERFAGVTAAALAPLPEKGLTHQHLRVAGSETDGHRVLLRIPRASHWRLAPADSLAYEAACFTRAAPAGHTPRLFDIIPPGPGLPFGALAVEDIQGRPPRLPDDLAAIAVALAAIHRLPLPDAAMRPPLASHDAPIADTLARIEIQATALDEIEIAPDARAAVLIELDWAREFAARVATAPQPITLVLTDTHPGNFLIEENGRAVFVDLEKALYGLPAIDLAHATLYTSTMWDADCAAALSEAEIRAFYRAYLDAVGPELAAALGAWLLPCRRLTWLRTITFCARWRAEAVRKGDWPPARLAPKYQNHLLARMDEFFDAQTIARIRSEWLGPEKLW